MNLPTSNFTKTNRGLCCCAPYRSASHSVCTAPQKGAAQGLLQFGCCSESKSVATENPLETVDYTSTSTTANPNPTAVKTAERSAKASAAAVVTAIRRHHRGSCVFVIFCIHYVCCLAAWASNYPAYRRGETYHPSSPLPSAVRENSSPGKITSRDGHNLVEARLSNGCGTFGAKTFISSVGEEMMAFTTEHFHVFMKTLQHREIIFDYLM